MDHSHDTQHCRAALHLQTNAFEGLVFNAYKRCLGWLTDIPLPDILRNLANYLEQDYSSNAYHNGWLKKVKTIFNSLTAYQQNVALDLLAHEHGTNAKERKSLFDKIVLDRELGFDKIQPILEFAKQKEYVNESAKLQSIKSKRSKLQGS
jgi:hypothetical protein